MNITVAQEAIRPSAMSRAHSMGLPAFFKIGRGLSHDLGSILRNSGFEHACIGILSGSHFSAKVADNIGNLLPPSSKTVHINIDNGSEAAVIAAHDKCVAHGVDLLLSVGGGKIIDVGKRIQRLFDLPNIVIPTIISNDGLMSPISVLVGANGRSSSVPSASPVGAVVDLDLIGVAPRRYLVAAAGDILSNISAAADWLRLTQSGTTSDFNDLAYQLSIGAAQSLINFRSASFDDDLFVENIVRCQIYSGLAMSMAGSSRPCSGAEHLLSHSIDQLGFTAKNMLHGIQVGSISLFTLSLLGEDMSRPLGFARKIGLPLDWRQLGPGINDSLAEIVNLSRTIRPGRSTILDEYDDEHLLREADRFCKTNIWEMS